MRFEIARKIDSRRMWQLIGYGLMIIAILFSSNFPLPVRAASAAPQAQPVAHLPYSTKLLEQGATPTSTALPTPTASGKRNKPTPAPAPTKGATSPRPLYSGPGAPVTFVNSDLVHILDNTQADVYPSTISVSGINGTVLAATVQLNDFSHEYTDDIDMILVGPTGQKTILMSDAGGSFFMLGYNLTFDDAASSSLPAGAFTKNGTYKPTDLNDHESVCSGSASDAFPAPAPSGPYPTTLSVFNGVNPNGNWQLFIVDDCTDFAGSLRGWSLTLYVQQPAIAPYTGSSQSASITTNFATPLQAQVKDGNGNPLTGNLVTFTAPASGASGTFAGGSTVYTGTTDASGLVTATTFTANTIVGSYTVTATASGIANPATFALTNTVGAANSVSVVSGADQSVMLTTAFSAPLVAKVTDSYGNPLSSLPITFAAPASGASGTFAGGSTVYTGTTDASGLVTATTFTANTIAGSYTVSATVSGVAASANFTLTNLAGTPNSISPVGGGGQSAQVNTIFSQPLVAKVTDSFDNPVSNIAVTFAAPASGASGTFAGGSAVYTGTTDASGTVTTTFTANTIVGSYTVSATVNGVATPAIFSLTNQCNPLMVTFGGDDGSCSTLRSAILYANTLLVSHDVTITVSTSVITVTSPLPTLQNPPGYSLILDGGCVASAGRGVPQTQLKAGAANLGTGLQLQNYIKVQGFKITGFSSAGVEMNGSNTLSCSWVGTADGTTAAPNGGAGVSIIGNNNTVGGSNTTDGVLISGNTDVGLGLSGGTGNLAQNVWIGLAQDGTTALRNGQGGLKVSAGAQLRLGTGNRIRS
jgi:subtilisin-like proprotein convertase family protein